MRTKYGSQASVIYRVYFMTYHTTHIAQLFYRPELNQLEDPRQQHLRFQQEFMLKEYLEHAHQDVVVIMTLFVTRIKLR